MLQFNRKALLYLNKPKGGEKWKRAKERPTWLRLKN